MTKNQKSGDRGVSAMALQNKTKEKLTTMPKSFAFSVGGSFLSQAQRTDLESTAKAIASPGKG